LISNLKNFEKAGIDPSSVIFMAYGIEVSAENDQNFFGVKKISNLMWKRIDLKNSEYQTNNHLLWNQMS
jgi:hypothetical protein